MKTVFMGTPDFAVPSLDSLIKSEHEVIGVFTRPDRRSGRGMELQPTPVKKRALESGIPVYQPEKLSESENFEILKNLNPDVIIVIAYSQFLKQNILDLPRFGCLNIHASLLPKYRGAAPIQWALAKGEKETGVCIMDMVLKMDAGDVYTVVRTKITEEDNAGTVHDRLSEMGAKALLKTLKSIQQGCAVKSPQDEALMSLAPQLSKKDGKIDWNQSVNEVFYRFQGFTPWPGAYTEFNGKTLTITKARVINQVVGCCEQETANFWLNDPKSLFAQCGKGVLEILEIKPQGKKPMSGADYFRGLKENQEFKFQY